MELCKFHKSQACYITKGACCIENLVLICENHVLQINFRVGVIDSFMPAGDGIQIRCQINTIYSTDNRQRKKGRSAIEIYRWKKYNKYLNLLSCV